MNSQGQCFFKWSPGNLGEDLRVQNFYNNTKILFAFFASFCGVFSLNIFGFENTFFFIKCAIYNNTIMGLLRLFKNKWINTYFKFLNFNLDYSKY